MTHSVVLPTAYGQMIVNRYDGNQTQHFLRTGRAIDHEEILNVSRLIEQHMDVIDVGACFGAWTLAFSQVARKVYSFEAQRLIANQLTGTIALNGLENVYVYNCLIGSERKIVQAPKYNYNDYLEFGCVYFCPRDKQGDMVQPTPTETEPCQMITLDDGQFRNIGLIKIDVEGMELDVLEGAKETIKNNRPILYLEVFLIDRDKLYEILKEWNYDSYDNGANLLAVPREKYSITTTENGTKKVTKLQ